MRLISTQLLIGPLAALALACSGTGHVDVAMGATSSPLTAAGEPAAESPHLVVTVARVDVNVGDDQGGADVDDPNEVEDPNDADGAKPPDAEDHGGGWVTVFTGPREIDLRDAASGEILLGGADVAPGSVKEIRLVLDGDARLVNGADVQTVRCPSCTSSGLKIKAQRAHITVDEGDTVHLVAVFDTVASVVTALDGLRLSPVIKLEAASK